MAFLQRHILMYLLEVKRKERKGRRKELEGAAWGGNEQEARKEGEGRFSAGAGQ